MRPAWSLVRHILLLRPAAVAGRLLVHVRHRAALHGPWASLIHALLWHFPEELVERVLQAAREDAQKVIELARLAQQHRALLGFQALQGTQCPDAAVPEEYLHVKEFLLGQLVLQRIRQVAVHCWHVAEPSSWSLLILVCQLGKRLAAPSVAPDIATVVMMFRGVHALVMSPGDVPDGNNTLWSSRKFLEPNATVLGTCIFMSKKYVHVPDSLQKSQKGFRQEKSGH